MTRIFAPVTHTLLSGTIIAETEKAIRFKVDTVDGEPANNPGRSFWFPLSRTKNIFRARHVDSDTPDTITVEFWLLNDKDLLP